jgi:hypothetical protein
MAPDGSVNKGNSSGPDEAALVESLAQLTYGWTPAAGVAKESLTVARAALAGSLLAGKTLTELHPVTVSSNAAAPVDPEFKNELSGIASSVLAASKSNTIAVVRSEIAATLNNPTGRPQWTSGAQVLQSYGPFQDLQGVLHWVELLPITRSIQFAFDTSASPFGVFPVHSLILPQPHPTSLTLGSGSVWFLANMLASTLPVGNFTGFTIVGGKLTSSAPMDLSNGVYVIPAGATLTATLSLKAAPAVTGNAGQDAAASAFTPPSHVHIIFSQSAASFQAVNDCLATAYGTSVSLQWNHNSPSQVDALPMIVVPCDPTPGSFTFAAVKSTLFMPAASALINMAGWALPLAATAISSLPEVNGSGSGLIEFGTGATLMTPVELQAVAVTRGLIEISTGGLFELYSGSAKPAKTVYQLWPLPAPSQLNTTLEFTTLKQFLFAFWSSPSEELFLSEGLVAAHLDRPKSATGTAFPFVTGGLLLLTHTNTADRLFLVSPRADNPKNIIPLSLTNALLGVDDPTILMITGRLNGLNLQNAAVGWFFNLRWLLATLPDPYAANFDLTVIPRELPSTIGILWAQISWTGAGADPNLGFVWLPPPQSLPVAATPFPESIQIAAGTTVASRVTKGGPALLDLSTRVDLFGVAVAPEIGRLAESGGERSLWTAGTVSTAPSLALTGMSLSLNSGIIATFALPQSSWEPMESTTEPPGPIFCEPASDGLPLLVSSPDFQQLIPFSPAPVLISNIENVASGHPFAALFSLPFGLNALIIQPNHQILTKRGVVQSSFLFEGGQFGQNRPHFAESFVPNPPPATPDLQGAWQLTLKPVQPDRTDAMFPGLTELDIAHGPHIGPTPNGYGYTIIGAQSGVGTMFQDQFGGGQGSGVPLRRIDFSGYGASIFSEWNKPDQTVGIVKVDFETSIGRTGHEVIQAVSVIYPYCIHVVRTITMTRHNAGWVQRTDSGWKAVSPGDFQFPPDISAKWTNAVHPGAFAGALNVRNIRDQADIINIAPNYQFRKVLFDADLGINSSLNVINGGFSAPVQGVSNPPVLVASKDMTGWVQITPLVPPGSSPGPYIMQALFEETGAFTPTIASSIEVGQSGSVAGTILRCSAFEVSIITQSNTGAPVPAIGVALRGAPQIPRGGGWSLGQRNYVNPAPAALPGDFPLPLVQPSGVTNLWYIANVTDVLQLSQPDTFYSLMHSTGTQKVLFESPQIPVAATTPGLQFPKPGPAKSGGAPANSGSPNLGDIASILTSTGLFPDIANAISLIQGAMEQINTIGQGFVYSKTYSFDHNQKVTLIDLGIINIALQYADVGNAALGGFSPPPAQLTYTVDSSNSPSWTLGVGPLSFLVTVPMFGSTPLLTITGGFYADEHTTAGLTNLNVQMGDALSVVKDVFSRLQTLAQFLPDGAGAQLDVALSDGKLTVSDTFSISDLPLGVGDLTDVSLDLGLTVTLQPLSVDFAVGIGNPDNPFNWIVSPLAGNGLMDIGVRANQPSLTIQAGIGLGLAIDLGIASGSASVTIAFQLDASGNTITLIAILSGQASVDVLEGLASASLTLSAAMGLGLTPAVPKLDFSPPLKPPPAPLPTQVTIESETITLIASCSVGIHISICWVVSVSWDGSWQFKQNVNTPQITVGI